MCALGELVALGRRSVSSKKLVNPNNFSWRANVDPDKLKTFNLTGPNFVPEAGPPFELAPRRRTGRTHQAESSKWTTTSETL